MKYKIENLLYAYNENGEIVKKSHAIRGNKYYLYADLTVELIFAHGEQRMYFRSKPGYSEYMNESPEHYNMKMKIVNDGYFDVAGGRIIPYRIESEKAISKQKRPDVIFYNKDDSIMCIIEVCHTNPKTEDDIIQFEKENLLVYETYTDTGRVEEICIPKEIERATKFYRGINRRNIARIDKQIQREFEYEKRKECASRNIPYISKIRCRKEIESISQRIRNVKREIRRIKDKRIEYKINHFLKISLKEKISQYFKQIDNLKAKGYKCSCKYSDKSKKWFFCDEAKLLYKILKITQEYKYDKIYQSHFDDLNK